MRKGNNDNKKSFEETFNQEVLGDIALSTSGKTFLRISKLVDKETGGVSFDFRKWFKTTENNSEVEKATQYGVTISENRLGEFIEILEKGVKGKGA